MIMFRTKIGSDYELKYEVGHIAVPKKWNGLRGIHIGVRPS